ncbi:MAG: methylmalonyl Co-A mutase-associated GTPase MeaB [Candidatus Marinimicrobia bacterium]|jgi:LAO/AO transport system kinase|nr:methylmalonyl Co-A mutase-associated GTPase MeaB [Candidatus Neomarinimicrobiota bacterium]MBT3936035.1 methylmalonyl Co-A mutase-associated GTPase MeaB [Candidatus Neomarinimicrobiota bacterium]MBT3960470.1 methylmalonyl Co-A mutase-associated GTPase MeaB [Candidatus Neomarinimicrobiota bacterium]MBT4383732.1 methylmalonyl Co-A mutase-associated GTPase MeaB [Candidatus Neomarinimicrobiota bacterium]MBT4636242.1 methylmalonyl Co-A mutase-associated GTPase MeaB [Candidatus Neomarinimicrobiota
MQQLIKEIKSNNHVALSRVISKIENGESLGNDFYQEIHTLTQDAIRIGITGPPGAGKSTLINEFISVCLDNHKSVGVVAVDPTSPFTGGALLGDRVRMNKFLWNDQVFIRSMGSHGELGGLARKAQDVGDVLAASGKDIIIFETVGVGQGEHDVAKAVDITIVVLVPESGDEIQLMKAGLIEIAEFFVVNKSDREGAGRLSQLLKNILHTFSKKGQIEPPVVNTTASIGEGISELYLKLMNHYSHMDDKNYLVEKKMSRYRKRVQTIIRENLESVFWTDDRNKSLQDSTASIDSIQISPHTLAKILLTGEKDDG